MRYVPVICQQCGATYQRYLGRVTEAIKLGRKQFCSATCQFGYQKTGKIVKCHTCGKDVYKTTSALHDSNSGKSFCSKSCAATTNNVNRDHSYTKNKKRVLCKSCNKEIKVPVNASSNATCRKCKHISIYGDNKKCKICNVLLKNKNKTGYCNKHVRSSDEYRNKLRDTQIKKISQGKHKGWTTRNILSYPEKYFKELLDNEFPGTFKINYPVAKRSLGLESDANYFLDFYFPDLKLDLEIDGKQHRYSERVESDRIRDKALHKAGYRVFRIRWYNPAEKNKNILFAQIEKLKKIIKQGVAQRKSASFGN